MATIKNSSPLVPRIAFYGICLIAVSWLVLTIIMETHFGVPRTGLDFAKRMVGWAIELWLMRTLFLGMRRSLFAMAR